VRKFEKKARWSTGRRGEGEEKMTKRGGGGTESIGEKKLGHIYKRFFIARGNLGGKKSSAKKSNAIVTGGEKI